MTEPTPTDSDTAAVAVTATADKRESEPQPPSVETESETFPREYVQQLREENAKYRQRAGKADELAHRLHTAVVAATGRLADPTDLPFHDEHLNDPSLLEAAIDELLARKPHLATRRPTGDIGQGATPSADTIDLAGILRARA